MSLWDKLKGTSKAMPLTPSSSATQLTSEWVKEMLEAERRHLQGIGTAIPAINWPVGPHSHGGFSGHTHSISSVSGKELVEKAAMQALAFRMGWNKEGQMYPVNSIQIYIGKEKTILFVVDQKEQPVILEDEINMFPSDHLVTALRLITG